MTTYDAAVIGAGVVGSATAYFMLKKGIKNVLLLEQVCVYNNNSLDYNTSLHIILYINL